MPAAAELTDALILRLHPVREADLIVTLLDPERGRVDAYARAARKSFKRFGGRLELFVRGRATLRAGRGNLPTLQGFERTGSLAPREPDWLRLCLSSFVAELAAIASQPEHADPELHAWACRGLEASDGVPTEAFAGATLGVELSFLRALGCLPELSRCAACGASTAAGAAWVVANEGWLCGACAPGRLLHFDAATAEAITRISRDPRCAGELDLPAAARRVLHTRVQALMGETLPRPPRTRGPLWEALAELSHAQPPS